MPCLVRSRIPTQASLNAHKLAQMLVLLPLLVLHLKPPLRLVRPATFPEAFNASMVKTRLHVLRPRLRPRMRSKMMMPSRPDVRDEGTKRIFMSPLPTEEQHNVLEYLCNEELAEERLERAAENVSKPPFDAIAGNPYLTTQYMHLLRSGQDAVRELKKVGLRAALQNAAMMHLLNPKYGNDRLWLA